MISRRDLIRAGASAALSPIAARVSALTAPGSFSFAFFSDTHVGLDTNIEEDRQMFQEMAGQDYAFGINAGDVTDYGWPDQYAIYRDLIKPVPFKIHCAPGNHDVRWSPLGPVAYRQGTGDPLYGSFDHQGVHFVTLDSTIPLSHYGHFEKAMLTWLERDLKRYSRETPTFLAFHHWVGRDGNQTDNDVDLLRILEPYNVKILLNGHGHSDLLWTWNGISNTMNKGLYQFSYERIEIDRQRQEVRLSRRTKEHPEMRPLLTLPLGPSKDKLPLWPSVVAASGTLAKAPLQSGQYRWDDHKWLPIPSDGIPTDKLVAGHHRLTVRSNASTYFYAGDVEISSSASIGRLRKLWEKALDGGVMSHLRLDGDTLFVSTMSGELCSLHASTGKPNWTAKTGGYCHSSPLVLDDLVVVGSADLCAYGFERKTGKQRWKFATQGPVYASAASAKGVVAIGSGDGNIYGLDSNSGQVHWKYPLPKSHTGFVQSPACTDGERFYFGAWDKFVYALDAASGDLVWRHDCCGERSFAYSPAIGGPVVANGKLYIPTDGNLLFAFDAPTGEVLWTASAPGDKVGYSGPCLVSDRIFIGCLGDIGQARCFSTKDGTILWTADVGSTIYDSSPSHADGVVAIGSVIGLLTTLSANDGHILGQYQLPPGHFLASPASSTGRVYAGSYSNRVVAFEFA